MREPTTLAEFEQRYNDNTQVTGFGLTTLIHHPCPFCAAKDWAIHPLSQTQEVLSKPRYCRECGRSAKTLFQVDSESTTFELVQTGGKDVPTWFVPKPRRV